MNKTFGYARVSTPKQTSDPQLELLSQTGGDEIFVETESGANRTRPELEKLLLLERESIT
ncbi:MAG: recombinase family protein [Gammaproteobacteria bacterium]|nr:recombinase family protein [Gammaproteobacteria bacterium]MDE0253001.1 recombinase family protein [Gammaproteobacteria bacterium]MDE0402355.1 recombinase family protein [Gammaproteobacteria bacterium]